MGEKGSVVDVRMRKGKLEEMACILSFLVRYQNYMY